ncbi:MAG: hypothetical protein D6791_00520 [Chloroflexi bacterium]|nr:MAG: hypothetical protein D6791_00520 [Chloroflexota bacterium]
MSSLQVRLLGGFLITCQNEPVTGLSKSLRLQSLLAYLLLHREAPQSQEYPAFLFWPASTEAQAFNNLRSLLHRLHHALPDAERFLHADAHAVQWRHEAPFTLDVLDFKEVGSTDLAERRIMVTVAHVESRGPFVQTP